MDGEASMSVLGEAMVDCAVGLATADRTGGMCLGTAGGQSVSRNVAATGGTAILEAKMKTVSALSWHHSIENTLLMLNRRHHRPRIVKGDSTLFAYLALNKANSNLAMPRRLRNVDDSKLN